jgi:hypothetical protein
MNMSGPRNLLLFWANSAVRISSSEISRSRMSFSTLFPIVKLLLFITISDGHKVARHLSCQLRRFLFKCFPNFFPKFSSLSFGQLIFF